MKIGVIIEKATLIGLLLFALACELAKYCLLVGVATAIFSGELLAAVVLGALAVMANSISGNFVEAVAEYC